MKQKQKYIYGFPIKKKLVNVYFAMINVKLQKYTCMRIRVFHVPPKNWILNVQCFENFEVVYG